MYIAASATSAENRILYGLDNCMEDLRRSATRNNGLTREHNRRSTIAIVAHPAAEQPPAKVFPNSHRVVVPDRLGNRTARTAKTLQQERSDTCKQLQMFI